MCKIHLFKKVSKPGESALISPPRMTFSSWLSCCRFTSCVTFQWWITAGSMKDLAWRRNVSYWNNCSFMALKTFSIVIKDAPLRYTAAERCRFPAGVLPRTGWLFQLLVNVQWGHHCFTDRNVPSLWVFTSHARVQTGHVLNKSMRQFSYTMYILLLWVEVGEGSDFSVEFNDVVMEWAGS